MNRMSPIVPFAREARVKYLDADYQVLSEGDFVRCGVTGQPIRLDELRYWSVERQEAYVSAEAAFRRRLEKVK
jgi:hypothetical protein